MKRDWIIKSPPSCPGSKFIPWKRARTAPLVVVGLVALTGCTQGANPVSLPGLPPNGTVSMPSVAASSVINVPRLQYLVTLTLSKSGGYTATATLARGALTHASAGMSNGAAKLGGSCQVNPQTDAVEPFQLTLTNTTSRFAAKPDVTVSVLVTNATPVATQLYAEVTYNNGPTCIDLMKLSPLSLGSTNQLAPGESSTSPGFLIVSGYYSPAHPGGGQEQIHDMVLTMRPQYADGYAITGQTGGVLPSYRADVFVNVDPQDAPGCLAQLTCHPTN
jgi:hypothetical protein